MSDLDRKLAQLLAEAASVAEIRLHPQTHKRVIASWAKVGHQVPVAKLDSLYGLRLVADDQVGIGWMHEHDAHGRLLRRIPPISEQRKAAN